MPFLCKRASRLAATAHRAEIWPPLCSVRGASSAQVTAGSFAARNDRLLLSFGRSPMDGPLRWTSATSPVLQCQGSQPWLFVRPPFLLRCSPPAHVHVSSERAPSLPQPARQHVRLISKNAIIESSLTALPQLGLSRVFSHGTQTLFQPNMPYQPQFLPYFPAERTSRTTNFDTKENAPSKAHAKP